MKTNDIKKGWEIRLEDGTQGTMEDNKKGIIRRQAVPSIFGSMALGDRYVFDIVAARENPDEEWVTVELTEDQQKSKADIERHLGSL